MNYSIPSWLQPSDPTGNMLAGLRQGAAIGEAQAQQAQFQQQLAARQQEEQQRLQAEALRRQAEMETQKAYRQAQQSLAQDRLKEEAQRAQEVARHNQAMEDYRGTEVGSRADAAAAKFAAQQKFADELQKNGGDVAKALIAVPGFFSPTTIPLLKPGRGMSGQITPRMAYRMYADLNKIPDRTAEQDQEMQAAQRILHGALVPPSAPAQDDYRPGSANPLPATGGTPPPAMPMNPVPPSAAAPAAQSPFKEGQRIKNKKDGKVYVVRNGQPVPVEALSAPAPAATPDTAPDETDTEQ